METDDLQIDPYELFSLEVREEAVEGTVSRARHGRDIRTPVDIRHEVQEKQLSEEITSRAKSGERFSSSLALHA